MYDRFWRKNIVEDPKVVKDLSNSLDLYKVNRYIFTLSFPTDFVLPI